MEFNLDIPHDSFFIRSVSESGIRVSDDYYTAPFIISGQRIIPEWNVASVDDFNEASLQVIFSLEPEVILIGTGNAQIFLPTTSLAATEASMPCLIRINIPSAITMALSTSIPSAIISAPRETLCSSMP